MKRLDEEVKELKLPFGDQEIDFVISDLEKGKTYHFTADNLDKRLSLVSNLVSRATTQFHMPTAIFSMEVSREDMINHFLITEACIDANRMRQGNMNPDEWDRLVKYMGILSEAPIYIDDNDNSFRDILSKCENLKEGKGLGLVIVDNYHSLEGLTMDNMKNVAQKLDVPIILLV